MRRHYGKCALCGEECNLTFEHIPPQSAFNKHRVRPVLVSDILKDEDRLSWDVEGLHYQDMQKGFGYYSLCQTCNNNTGTWYGDAYSDFVHASSEFVRHCPVNPSRKGIVKFMQVYPLRIIKQVVSMFCSINYSNSSMDGLRSFVLDKNSRNFPKDEFKVCLLFIQKSQFIRPVPFSVAITDSFTSIRFSEISTYPLSWVLYFNPEKNTKYFGTDISNFSDYEYDQLGDIALPALLYEVNSAVPLNFQSKEEIIKAFTSDSDCQDDIHT